MPFRFKDEVLPEKYFNFYDFEKFKIPEHDGDSL